VDDDEDFSATSSSSLDLDELIKCVTLGKSCVDKVC